MELLDRGAALLKMRILIVDDVPFMRTMLKDILIKDGLKIVGEADNGFKAIEMYKELKPDLITLDITMPEMDGISAIKAIKAFDPSAKIVICSAMSQQFTVVEAIQAGAKDFIIKPFLEERIIRAIRKALV